MDKRRWFASMDPARVRQIASSGGKAAHAAGTAHRFSKEEATAAGKKGGVAPHRSRGRQLVAVPEPAFDAEAFAEDEEGPPTQPRPPEAA